MVHHSFPMGLPSFYIRIYQIVDDPSSDPIISWSKTNDSFIIWNRRELIRKILPKSLEFGTNLTQFVSELQYHGFKRIEGPGQWEFGHDDGFVRGHPELLKKMTVKSWSVKRKAKEAKAKKARRAIKKVESLFLQLHI